MLNIPIVSKHITQFILAYLNTYYENIINWIEYLKDKSKSDTILYIKCNSEGEIKFLNIKFSGMIQNYFNDKEVIEKVIEANSIVLNLITKLCEKESTGNGKIIARTVFIKLLKGLDEIADVTDNIMKRIILIIYLLLLMKYLIQKNSVLKHKN